MATNLKARTLFALLVFAISGKVLAQTAPTAKIAIVNVQAAIGETNEGKQELAAMQQRFAPKQATLKAAADEVERLKSQLQTDGAKLSDDDRGKRVSTVTAKQRTLQRDLEEAQAEFQQAEQETVNRLGKKMLELLDKYAKSHGYALIVDVSSPQTPVLWALPSLDISKELVDAYNAATPVAAPPPKK